MTIELNEFSIEYICPVDKKKQVAVISYEQVFICTGYLVFDVRCQCGRVHEMKFGDFD
jgi:hypothetical protein